MATTKKRGAQKNNAWVIVKKSSPKNLSADSRPTVGNVSVTCR